MKYMLLIYGRDDYFESPPEEVASGLEQHGAFAAYLQGRGIPFSGEALHGSKTATTVRPSGNGDGFMVTDGPFVELKENLGGFYLIDAADLDDAIEVAKRCPADYAVEVRPVWTFES